MRRSIRSVRDLVVPGLVVPGLVAPAQSAGLYPPDPDRYIPEKPRPL